MLKKIVLYINTIRYLKWIQIIYQIKERVIKKKKKLLKGKIPSDNFIINKNMNIVIPELDLDREYLSRFDVDALENGWIKLLHETYPLNIDTWKEDKASHLWNFNLQYLEYLIPLAVKAQNNKKAFYCWENYVNHWKIHRTEDSYAAYTISLRIPNLLICMKLLENQLDDKMKTELYQNIYEQYQLLMKEQELSLLANHYFENLKCLVICSILFEEENIYERFFSLLLKQIDEQILPDGVHFELSWMYHKIILEDILRIYTVLYSAGKMEDAKKLINIIQRMVNAVASVEKGIGHTPLFNDSGNNMAKSSLSLICACEKIGIQVNDNKTSFPYAGYFKLYDNDNALIFDCGALGPLYMSGHGHCDCLSFELARKNKLVFINSGTFQYQSRLRAFFRSTAAHNTVMVNNHEQSELWGEHRAARRLANIKCKVLNSHCLSGEFVSYKKDKYNRILCMDKDTLFITDIVYTQNKNLSTARQFFHLAPDYHYYYRKNGLEIGNKEGVLGFIAIPEGSRITICQEGDIINYSNEIGLLEKKEVLEIDTDFYKSVTIKIKIKFVGE